MHNTTVLFLNIFLISCFGYSQVTDTLFYNESWQITARGSGIYYRIATMDTTNLKFTGKFEDYYQSGALLLSGSYDTQGLKQGEFLRYYPNKQLYTKGNYKDNEQTGRWEYYYQNGQLGQIIVFSEDDFTVLEFYDVDGNQLITNGTGEWVKDFYPNQGGINYLYASFVDGKRTGVWKYKDQNDKVLLREEYEEGRLKKGKQYNWNTTIKYRETKFEKDMFYPSAFNVTEQFAYSVEVYREGYPYFDFLPLKYFTQKEILGEGRIPDEEFTIVEESAEYQDGMYGFYMDVKKHLRYPKEAKKLGVEGKVFVEFVIQKDGSVTDIKIVKGIGAGCDKEVLRVIKLCDKWKSGRQRGKPVKQKIVLPIVFSLG